MAVRVNCRSWCYRLCLTPLRVVSVCHALRRPLPYLSRTQHNDSPTSHSRDLFNIYNNLANFVNRQRLKKSIYYTKQKLTKVFLVMKPALR